MIPTEPVVFWRYFDVLVIALVTSVVVWSLLTHRSKNGALLPSISQTVAADKRSSLAFSLVMTICVPLYYAFIWFWVGPLAAAPGYFYVLLLVSIVAEMVFVWVPATTGKSKTIHEFTAGFVGIVMLVAPLILLLAGQLGLVAKIAVVTFAALSALLGTLILTPRFRKYTLVYEAIYCAVFWAVMSIIAHT